MSSATETHRASVHSLSTITADDDAPYLPPASASGPTPRLPSYLNPADLTPEAPDTFIFPQEMCVGDDVFDSPSSSNAHPAGRAIPATTPSARHRRAPARKYRDADSDEEEEEAEEEEDEEEDDDVLASLSLSLSLLSLSELLSEPLEVFPQAWKTSIKDGAAFFSTFEHPFFFNSSVKVALVDENPF